MATNPSESAEPTATLETNKVEASTGTAQELIDLTTQANLQYSLKHYAEAAELYSTACQLQDEIHGEMNPQNAELFYLYGRALYKVAVEKSDVLGGQVAQEKKRSKANGAADKKSAGVKTGQAQEEKLAGEVLEAVIEENEAPDAVATEKAAEPTVESKPFFQITGMENWDSDEEDEEGDEGEAQAAVEEEDDFATAYEILDVARLLSERQIEALKDALPVTDGKGKGKATSTGLDEGERRIKERLADTHDLQAEISLENERFADAIPDSRAALELMKELHPKESSYVAEAHFKLSLALEFASVTALREAQAQDGEAAKVKKEDVDESMREEAAKQMEYAIESCRLRIAKEEKDLESLDEAANTKQKKSIAEVKEIVEDMEQRLVDLRGPAVSLVSGPAGAPDPALAASGILAQHLGETAEEQKKRIEAATKNANDLSGLVKRKKPKVEDNINQSPAGGAQTKNHSTTNGNGKRKLDDEAEGGGEKKAKVDDA